MSEIAVTVASADGERVEVFHVDPAQRVGSLAPELHQKFGIPPEHQVLMHNGTPLAPDMTFLAAAVADGILVLSRAAHVASVTSNTRGVRSGMRLHDIPPNPTPEALLEIMQHNPHLLAELELGNPKLAQALKTKQLTDVRMVLLEMHMEAAARKFKEQEEMMALERDPFNAEAQAQIAERIRLSNVQKNMEIAIEEMPEAFARVYMLYIPCEVNGVPVKAFVDSGAQSTIMSSSCAERCGIMRLVDTRFAGQAVGVGTAKIIGRVHMAPLKIGNYFYNCSFTILDQQSVDFLFGLDMLKRHQCCIDLYKNVLRLQDASGGHEVPFLPEHEIPVSDQAGSAIGPSPTAGSAPAATPTPAPPVTMQLPNAEGPPVVITPAMVQGLVSLGFSEEQARRALESTHGNVDLAAGLLFESL